MTRAEFSAAGNVMFEDGKPIVVGGHRILIITIEDFGIANKHISSTLSSFFVPNLNPWSYVNDLALLPVLW